MCLKRKMAETDNFGRKKSEEKYNILKITRNFVQVFCRHSCLKISLHVR